MLSQAYAVLHAEYMALTASQLNEQSYPRQYDVGPYGGGGGGSHAHMGLGAGDGVDGVEIDVFVYPDITGAAGRGNTF